jgi:Rrf2 family protein
MKLSTRTRRATLAMFDLACHFGESPIPIREVSTRQEISEEDLRSIFLALKRAGLVKVVPGAPGAFRLAKPPSQINLIEIVEAMDGSTAPVECLIDASICQRSGFCVAREVWLELRKAVDSMLEFTTLQDMVERQKEKEPHGQEEDGT